MDNRNVLACQFPVLFRAKSSQKRGKNPQTTHQVASLSSYALHILPQSIETINLINA